MKALNAAAVAAVAVMAVPQYWTGLGSALFHDVPPAIASAMISSAEAKDRIKAHRDIPWYETHPVERAEMLRRCHKDTLIGRSPDCANAELGSVGARARAGLGWNKPSDGIIPLDEYVRLHGG